MKTLYVGYNVQVQIRAYLFISLLILGFIRLKRLIMQAFRTSCLFAVFVGVVNAEEQLFSVMSFTLQKFIFK
jgi:hypothetical membrane protein